MIPLEPFFTTLPAVAMVKLSQDEQKLMLANVRKCRQPLAQDPVTDGLMFLEEALIREHGEAPVSVIPNHIRIYAIF